MSFDPYATSFDASQFQSYSSDFSPVLSLFDTLEDFGTDFASESAASPISPISPVLSTSSYGYPVTDGWFSWDQTESSPEPETHFQTNPFGPLLTRQAQNPCLSPAINPMDLAMSTELNSEGLNSQSPIFQSSMLPALPSQQPSTMIKEEPLGDDAAKRYPSRNLKRKSFTPSLDDELLLPPKRSSPPPAPARRGSKDNKDAGPKKTAHNMIEKRYRTNLNDKISQLRDAVPSLRAVAQRTEHPGACDEARDDYADDVHSGLSQAARLNKATILAKATEYIGQLESRNHGLETENNALRGRMEAMEMLLMSRGGGVAGMPVWN